MSKKDIRIHKGLSRKIIITGFPCIINTAAAAILSIVIVNSLKMYGEDIHITILGIYNRTFPFVFLPMIGVMQALQPIIGVNFGAKEGIRVNKALNISLCIVTVIGCIGLVTYYLCTQEIIRAFSNDRYLINLAVRPYRITILMLPVLGLQIIGAGYFQAIGKPIPALILALSRPILFMVPLIIILPLIFQLDGVWYAVPFADLLSASLTASLLIKSRKRELTLN